jgi:hypothetical protein
VRPKNIAVGDLVVSPLNVRADIGDIRTLAESVQQEGLLHPLTVRPYGDKFEIVAGRRRYEACKLIGMKVIPCNVADEMDDRRAVLVSLKENLRRGDITAAEKKRAVEKLLQFEGGDSAATRRKVAGALNMTVGELKATFELGEWAETFEPHNIAVKVRTRGEAVGKTVVPTSVARTLMKTLKDDKVKETLAEVPKEDRNKIEADFIREAVALKGKGRQEFVKEFVKDPLRPAPEIKRDVLAPSPSQPLMMTIPVRVENDVYEPLKQYALDNNLGDRVGFAARNLITEGLAGKGYLQRQTQPPPT